MSFLFGNFSSTFQKALGTNGVGEIQNPRTPDQGGEVWGDEPLDLGPEMENQSIADDVDDGYYRWLL